MEHTDILINIRRIVRSLNIESKRIQKEHGISIPQLLCLNFLSSRNNFQASLSEISAYLNLNMSTTTGIINRLQNRGIVARLPRMKDKRVTPVALTSKGADIIKKSPELIHDQLSRKLSKMPENKLKEIREALNLLVKYLEIEDVPASAIITIDEPIVTVEDPDKQIRGDKN